MKSTRSKFYIRVQLIFRTLRHGWLVCSKHGYFILTEIWLIHCVGHRYLYSLGSLQNIVSRSECGVGRRFWNRVLRRLVRIYIMGSLCCKARRKLLTNDHLFRHIARLLRSKLLWQMILDLMRTRMIGIQQIVQSMAEGIGWSLLLGSLERGYRWLHTNIRLLFGQLHIIVGRLYAILVHDLRLSDVFLRLDYGHIYVHLLAFLIQI